MSEYSEEKLSESNIDIIKIKDNNYVITYEPMFIFLFDNYKIKYKRENRVIMFECESIQSLNEFIKNNGNNNKLDYNTLIKLIYDTGILIKSLEEERRGIFCFSLNDFVVINNNLFLFINTLKISNIQRNHLTLKLPININENFIDKYNIINFSHLPIKHYYTHSYYSFGSMVFYLLTGERYSNENKNILNQIYQTPLYFFLLRCLNGNQQERYYLYI